MLDVKSAGETFAREQEEDSLSDVLLIRWWCGSMQARGGEGGDSKKLSHAIPAAGKARCHAIPVHNSCKTHIARE